MDNILIKPEAFAPWQSLHEFESARFADSRNVGAATVFVGTMRDFNEGDTVQAMTLEHYPGMTDNYLQEIAAQAKSRWDIHECLIIHRVGEIQPGEPIVLTAAWSAHRKAAFEACRYLIEELKHRAPFWKKETLTSGDERWVAENTAG